jgi:type II secretory pathway component PulJ
VSDVRRQGLTLLEVLAAFLIFSLVFTVLVGSSQTAVHSQGLSVRRLAANELAESTLADLEIAMARHELPTIEEEEFQLEEFTVRVREEFLAGEAAAIDPGDPAALAALASGTDVLGLLQAQLPDVAQYLKRYEVEVEWMEANQIQTVARTTFAFDWPSAQADATGLLGAAAAANDATRDDEDGDQESDSDSADDASQKDRARKSGGDQNAPAKKPEGISQEDWERYLRLPGVSP